MGYRAEKEKVEEKAKKLKRIALCVVAVITVALLIFASVFPPESWKFYFNTPKVGARKEGELRIHYISVGQGDGTLIELPDGKIMLIDGGNNTSYAKTNLLRYLNALDVDEIDYLVVTHTDGDHCGALDEVFRYKKVKKVYLPCSYAVDKPQFAEVYDLAVEKECAIVTSSRSIVLDNTEGQTPYALSFLYPYAEEARGEKTEEPSAVVWLDYFGTSAIFCGDNESAVEKLLIEDSQMGLLSARAVDLSSTEILKVAHHGSDTSSCAEFLKYLQVKTAVISCGKDNEYGHPHREVLRRLSEVGAEVYRTDERGHVVITANMNGKYSVRTIKAD